MKRIHPELSDLYFNHQHCAREALYSRLKGHVSAEEAEIASLEDAREFSKSYPQVIEFFGSPTAVELSRDFLGRI